jgi:hypothetical protein
VIPKPLLHKGAKVFAGSFSEGAPVSLPTGYVFLQSSAKVSPEPVFSAVAHPTGQPSTGIARLNSRNRSIITTPLHIVNHSSLHRRKEQNSKSQGFKSLKVSRVSRFQEFQGFKSFKVGEDSKAA